MTLSSYTLHNKPKNIDVSTC